MACAIARCAAREGASLRENCREDAVPLRAAMADEKRDSTQALLEDIEGGWASPSSARLRAGAPPTAATEQDPARDDGGASVVDGTPISTPTLDSLEAGWIDELFDEDEEDEDDEPDAPEPDLPDEAVDPEAYAAAKKAREEREQARRQKRKAKAEEKRARRKARAQAAQQQQKQKKKRAGAASAKRGRLPDVSRRTEAVADAPLSNEQDDDGAPPPPVKRIAATSAAARQGGRPPWHLLALAIVVFLAAAAAVAAFVSR